MNTTKEITGRMMNPPAPPKRARNAPTPSPAATSANARPGGIRGGIWGDHQQIHMPEAVAEQPDRASLRCPDPDHLNDPVTNADLLGGGIPDRRAQRDPHDHHPEPAPHGGEQGGQLLRHIARAGPPATVQDALGAPQVGGDQPHPRGAQIG